MRVRQDKMRRVRTDREKETDVDELSQVMKESEIIWRGYLYFHSSKSFQLSVLTCVTGPKIGH